MKAPSREKNGNTKRFPLCNKLPPALSDCAIRGPKGDLLRDCLGCFS
jgi:hypothetical protein